MLLPEEDQILLKNTIELICFRILLRTAPKSEDREDSLDAFLDLIRDHALEVELDWDKWEEFNLQNKVNLKSLLTSENPLLREFIKKEMKNA